MRKKGFIGLILLSLLFIWPITGESKQTDLENTYQIIPDDAIRLRILANSDGDKDQQLKRLIRDEVSDEISIWVEYITNIDEARALIASRMDEIESIVARVLARESIEQDIQVAYGKNVTFPHKLYDSYLYPAGEYEAVLITLGEGKGSNWWCVLFPPLCFLDFSSGASVADSGLDDQKNKADKDVEEKEQPVKVKFFLFEWFGWT